MMPKHIVGLLKQVAWLRAEVGAIKTDYQRLWKVAGRYNYHPNTVPNIWDGTGAGGGDGDGDGDGDTSGGGGDDDDGGGDTTVTFCGCTWQTTVTLDVESTSTNDFCAEFAGGYTLTYDEGTGEFWSDWYPKTWPGFEGVVKDLRWRINCNSGSSLGITAYWRLVDDPEVVSAISVSVNILTYDCDPFLLEFTICDSSTTGTIT